MVSFNIGAKAREEALEMGNTARVDTSDLAKTPWNETSLNNPEMLTHAGKNMFATGVTQDFMVITYN